MFPAVLRRGRGTAVNFYATGVHQDYGVNPTEFEANILAYGGDELAQAYRERINRAECTGQTLLCFWRVTNM